MREKYPYIEKMHEVGDNRPADAIYEQLKKLVISGDIAVGSRLPSERKMMEVFSRSRSTIREALRLLEKDGYIERVSRSSGAVVKEPGVEGVVESLESIIQMNGIDIADVLEFRLITETRAAAAAAEYRSEEELSKMKDILLESRLAKGDADRFADCDLRFHLSIAEASKNRMFQIMLLVCRHIMA
ncbi:GntR family transcriptional regulator, transcriptional repressor for pyruvate dehydrogenase complex [Eubacterium oxidoreducens]|uniref:GntR family transcriptional regulator, transcriptional repressor for pyruvate dehydrogenase complex n=1 Tax=Eubacterium oxidoreducens TaxID=1732 RepID=A0A1G6CI36_EUBOX|nr:GntR family transcriptional regulator, transcriptional repressor for pyruvate dehydrogenase complex [Eubacterium oxidoreducens]